MITLLVRQHVFQYGVCARMYQDKTEIMCNVSRTISMELVDIVGVANMVTTECMTISVTEKEMTTER